MTSKVGLSFDRWVRRNLLHTAQLQNIACVLWLFAYVVCQHLPQKNKETNGKISSLGTREHILFSFIAPKPGKGTVSVSI